jgi:hypothetical protein
LFLEKPDRKIYPDYYLLVPRPIGFKDILTKLKKKQYVTIEEVELDFALMSHNARMYNLDSSPVYAECESLREEFHMKTASVRGSYNLAFPLFLNGIEEAAVLLDDLGNNVAIPVMAGTRPPLPERAKGYVIYSKEFRISDNNGNGIGISIASSSSQRNNRNISSLSSSSNVSYTDAMTYDDDDDGDGDDAYNGSKTKRVKAKTKKSAKNDDDFSPERKKSKRSSNSDTKPAEKLVLSLSLSRKQKKN